MDIQQVKRQWAALGQSSYEIVKMRWNEEENKTLHQHDMRDWPAMEKQHLRYANAIKSGENLYIRAYPNAPHEIIFLDDLTPAAVDFLKKSEIIPACVVQTSSTDAGVPRLHAWIRLADAQETPVRKAVERILIDRLHAAFPDPIEKNMPGDRGSNDGIHLGRLAGTWNHGLNKPRDCPVTLIEATGYILPPDTTALLLTEATPFIDLAPKKRQVEAETQDIIDHIYERPEIVSVYVQKLIPRMDTNQDHFKQDFWTVCHLINSKFSEMDIKKCLLEHNPNPICERKAGREAFYLQRTIDTAKANMKPKPRRQAPTNPPAQAGTSGGGSVHSPAGAGEGFTSSSEVTVIDATDLSPAELNAISQGLCHGSISRAGVIHWGKSYANCIII